MFTSDVLAKTTSLETEVPTCDVNDDKSLSNFTNTEICNLSLQVLCYACLMSSTTMVVGTSAVVIQAVGGSNEIAPLPIGIFFIGSSFISLATTRIFRFGRQDGFLVGIVFGLAGASIGALATQIKSPALLLFAYLPLGMSFGIGNYLRFAAVEVVKPPKKAVAVTLVLAGGILAAFAGPESAQATKSMFGDDVQYLGTFMMIFIFNAIMAILQGLIRYPKTVISNSTRDEEIMNTTSTPTLQSLLLSRHFIVPALVASFSWAIMALSMSVVRVAMGQLGYSSRASLQIIELHFLGMFAPGFVTGMIIERKGEIFTIVLGVILFTTSTILNLMSTENGTIAFWIVGIVLTGVGWNFAFSSSTIMLTRAYTNAPELKNEVQAANDFTMFFLAGSIIVSSGYIYKAGGSGVDGWKAVNFTVVALITLICGVVVSHAFTSKRPVLQCELECSSV
jgi:MFS family permease